MEIKSISQSLGLSMLLIGVARGQVTCSGTFEPISAAAFNEKLAPGWNLGNSLDAFPNEDSWNNPAVVESTFDDVKARGFKSVRVPVTWAYHFTGGSDEGDSPDWTVDPAWLQRVSDVLDMVTTRGLYTIVNVHHDSRLWADLTPAGSDWDMVEEKFYRLWHQIGTFLACKSSMIAFEAINEAPGTTAEEIDELHKLNDIFLQAINDAGGFNPQRVVSLSGPGQDLHLTKQHFQPPSADYPNSYILQVHYYLPYDFTSAAWGKTIWGSNDDKAAMEADLDGLRAAFPDTPIVIGEWLVSPVHSEPAARWKYYDFFSRTASRYSFATIIWDAGNDHLDRASHLWHDATGISVHINAVNRVTNSLPDSTVDTSLATQSTSAFVFLKASDALSDKSLPFLLKGNSFTAVADASGPLEEGTDYLVDGTSIVFKQSYLASYFDSGGENGVKGSVTVSFSAGADTTIQIVQWSPPKVPTPSSVAVDGTEVVVAVDWEGVAKPAAVAAYLPDGTPLVDSWTIYNGPLQRGRTTFGGQWTWNWGQDYVTITASAASAVVAAGQTTTFVIEAYPRVEGNSVNYTLTVQ